MTQAEGRCLMTEPPRHLEREVFNGNQKEIVEPHREVRFTLFC